MCIMFSCVSPATGGALKELRTSRGGGNLWAGAVFPTEGRSQGLSGGCPERLRERTLPVSNFVFFVYTSVVGNGTKH